MIIDKNGNMQITTEKQFYEFIKEIFKIFQCEVDDCFINGGDFEFKIDEKGNICIEQLWINIINNNSVENYKTVLDTVRYIQNRTNIKLNIVDVCII